MAKKDLDNERDELGLETVPSHTECDDETHDSVDKDIDQENVDDKDDPNAGLPIDRGWAWVIAAACFFEMFIFGGIMRAFGVFFLQFQKRFNSSAAETSIMNMIQNVVISIAALFVMTIGLKKFSCRVAAVAGAILTVASYLISAFTTDIGVFYFSLGVLGGLGMAFVHPPLLAIIGVYFNKHRGLANSIFASGGSLGGLIFAPIVVKLFDQYGYTGTMLIVSGLLMNILVAALLLRPLEFYSKRVNKKRIFADKSDQSNPDTPLLNDNTKITGVTTVNEIKDSNNEKEYTYEQESEIVKNKINTGKVEQFRRMQSYDPENARKQQNSPLLHRVRAHSFGHQRQRTTSENSSRSNHDSKSKLGHIIDSVSRSQIALYSSGEGICGSFLDINVPQDPSTPRSKRLDSVTEDAENKNTCCMSLQKSIVSVVCTVFDVHLLRNTTFLLFLLMAFCIMSGVALVPVFIAPHASDVGLTNTQIGVLLSIQACVDLVSKITMGIVADRKWISRSNILAFVAFLLGTAGHLARFINGFYTVLIYVIIAGFCCGQYLSIYAVLLLDVIGVEKFKQSLGFGTLIHGMSIAIFFPIGGMLKDYTGRYIASFHLCGTLAYLGGILVLLIARVQRLKNSKDQTAKQTEENNKHDD